MDVAFARFVGSGLLLWASGCRTGASVQKFGNGLEFIAHLGVLNRSETRQLVDELVTHVWQTWRDSAMPHQVTQTYLDVLSQIISENNIPPAFWIGVVAQARIAVKHRESMDEIAARLVDRMFEPDSALYKIDSNELDDYVAGTVLMQLFVAIMQRQDLVQRMMPLIEDYYRALAVAQEEQLAEKAREYLQRAAS